MFTLLDRHIVLAGELVGVAAEDAKWKLIERGARVMPSVTKSTALVVLGASAKKAVLAGIAKHGTPTTDEAGLARLLEGATIAEVLGHAGARREAREARPLAGKRVAFDGAHRGHTRASMTARLEALGATVAGKPSARLDLLVLGEAPGSGALDALDAGVPSLEASDVDALEGGTPLTALVAARGPACDDARARCLDVLEAARAAMLTIDLGGERWDDEVRVTVHPDGRLAVKLRELGGTPTEAHVRRVLLRQTWPTVSTPVEVSTPLTFPG